MTFGKDTSLFVNNISSKKLSWVGLKRNLTHSVMQQRNTVNAFSFSVFMKTSEAATEHRKFVFICCVHEDKRCSNGTQKICFHLLCSWRQARQQRNTENVFICCVHEDKRCSNGTQKMFSFAVFVNIITVTNTVTYLCTVIFISSWRKIDILCIDPYNWTHTFVKRKNST